MRRMLSGAVKEQTMNTATIPTPPATIPAGRPTDDSVSAHLQALAEEAEALLKATARAGDEKVHAARTQMLRERVHKQSRIEMAIVRIIDSGKGIGLKLGIKLADLLRVEVCDGHAHFLRERDGFLFGLPCVFGLIEHEQAEFF